MNSFNPNIAPIGAKRRRGRPRSLQLELYRQMFPEWSPRSITRFAEVSTIMNAIGEDPMDALRHAKRPNGSVSVHKALQYANRRLFEWMLTHRDDSPHQPHEDTR